MIFFLLQGFTNCFKMDRCDAHWSDLDNNIGGRRAHVLTEALTDALRTKTLWNDYGIVDGIMVQMLQVVQIDDALIFLWL
jgi:hypothetical protein